MTDFIERVRAAGIEIEAADLAIITDPEFEKAGRVHDWRNHVPEAVKRLWPALSDETRLIPLYIAQDLAGAEEWN